MKNNTKTILFRTDSSSDIGTGHIMRDLVLANQHKDSRIIFAVQDLKGNINDKIPYPLHILKTNKPKELIKLIKTLHVDMLVIDHYDIDYEFEKQLKIQNSTLKILSFDDTYEKHYCDILLNHNISADEKRYKNLVPKKCELRCGSKYTLLRDEFYKEKKKLKDKKQFRLQNVNFNIFLAMGGADHSNINIQVLKVLKQFDNIEINLVTTTANKNLDALKKYAKNKKWINLYINSDKIAKLMRKSNLAIVTPSVVLNEVYFMELPFVAIKTAANQEDLYQFLKENDFLVLKKFTSKRLERYVKIKYKKLNLIKG